MRGATFLGLIITLIGVILLLNPLSTVKLLSTSHQNIELFSNLTNETTTLNLQFEFDPDYITKYSTISNGEKLYHTYLNVFCNEFKDNSTNESLTSLTLNNNFYLPTNKSYETSLVITEETLNPYSNIQHLTIEKSANLTIDKVTLEYIGLNYNNKETYNLLSTTIAIIIIFSGILLVAIGSKI